MLKIHKYFLTLNDQQWVQMPKDAEILCVQTQRNNICVWARVNESKPIVRRLITIRGTGHPCLQEDGKYLGTIQLKDGLLILHVFDGGEL